MLSDVRKSLTELLGSILGENRRATDLHDLLGLDYKLCWQVVNVVKAPDPLAVYQHVPSEMATKKLVTAARAHGTPPEILDAVSRTIKAYHQMIEEHSSDRQEFDVMLSSMLGGEAATAAAIQNRRAAFKYESQIWGMQVRLHFHQLFVKRAENGDGFDEVSINGKLGMYQLRQNANSIVHGSRAVTSGVSSAPSRVVPLEPEAAAQFGAPLLPAFCTQPLPKFKTSQTDDGWVYTMLDSDEVGRKGAVDLTFGAFARGTQPARDSNDHPVLRYSVGFIAPTESAVLEVFVHRESFGFVNPMFRVIGNAAGTVVPESLRHDWVTTIQQEQNDATPVAGIPRYNELVHYAFDKMKWNASDFALFRVHMSYPILHTRAELVFPVKK